MSKIKILFQHTPPTENWCCYYTFINAGKLIFSTGGTAYFSKKNRKIWQSKIQYSGKSQYCSKGIFGKPCVTSGGVRFFAKYDEHFQISKYGVRKIISDIIPDLIDIKWSEVSAIKIKCDFGKDKYKPNLGIELLETVAVAKGEKIAEVC